MFQNEIFNLFTLKYLFILHLIDPVFYAAEHLKYFLSSWNIFFQCNIGYFSPLTFLSQTVLKHLASSLQIRTKKRECNQAIPGSEPQKVWISSSFLLKILASPLRLQGLTGSALDALWFRFHCQGLGYPNNIHTHWILQFWCCKNHWVCGLSKHRANSKLSSKVPWTNTLCLRHTD